MNILAHTMQFVSDEEVSSSLALRNYRDSDYLAYRDTYHDCFVDMRRALRLHPVNCCDDRKALLDISKKIFILEIDNQLAGSVAIYGNEIDDLFVAKQHQRKGYGQRLLRFAVARMQRTGVSPIMLHVADWNRGAIALYTKNGFRIIQTETV